MIVRHVRTLSTDNFGDVLGAGNFDAFGHVARREGGRTDAEREAVHVDVAGRRAGQARRLVAHLVEPGAR